MTTIAEFVSEHGITIETLRTHVVPGFVPHVEPFNRRPSGMMPTPAKDDDGWQHFAWAIRLKRPGLELDTTYRMGIAHVTKTGHRSYYPQWGESLPFYEPTPPTAEEVLDSLAGDASFYLEARDFEDFAASLGYDSDSRKAEKLYHECGEIAKKLRSFLGAAAAETLLFGVERL